jgi:NDP-sugar pyrophosphorylase family protein
MKAIILAAGEGTRMRPVTYTCPKAVLTIGGRPLLLRTLDWLKTQGITDAIINLHHLPAVIWDVLDKDPVPGVRIHFSYESSLLGTSGAIRRIVDNHPEWLRESFLVIYGDMLIDIDLSDLVRFHYRKRSDLTIALKSSSDYRGRGMVEIAPPGRVLSLVEKPQFWTGSNLSNAGLYICEPAILPFIPQGISDFSLDVIPRLIERGMFVYGRLATGYLKDIGTPEGYAQAEDDWRGA